MKTTLLRFLSFFLIVMIPGCDEESEPVKIQIFTVQVASDYFFGQTNVQGWLYVTDQNGEYIGTEEFHDGSQVEFYAEDVPERVNITVAWRFDFVATKQMTLNTYMDVPFREVFQLKRVPFSSLNFSNYKGTLKLAVTNYSESPNPWQAISISTEDSPRTNAAYDIRYEGTTYSATQMLFRDFTTMIITGYRQGIPVYKILENVKPDDIVQLDFNEFEEAEQLLGNTLQFDFGGGERTAASIFGFKGDHKMHLFSSDQILQTSSWHLPHHVAYIAGFDRYEIVYNRQTTKGFLTYVTVGDPVDQVEAPEVTYEVLSKSIFNMVSTTNVDRDLRIATWTDNQLPQNRFTTWTIHAPGNKEPRLFTTPINLLARIPEIRFDRLTMQSSGFTDYHSDYAYDHYVLDAIQGVAQGEQEYLIFLKPAF